RLEEERGDHQPPETEARRERDGERRANERRRADRGEGESEQRRRKTELIGRVYDEHGLDREPLDVGERDRDDGAEQQIVIADESQPFAHLVPQALSFLTGM